ncbi:phosphoglycerate kinase [Candidatus Woesearchaeota archaeon]|nr:phosphoglycerate kinase [Candidatus Woesearchaeota archaeon]
MYEKVKRLDDFDFSGKKVVMRCDFNVPIDKKTGEITSCKRIEAALPSIRKILENADQLILMSHLGKPKKEVDKGKSIDDIKKSLSLQIVADKLKEFLGEDVALAEDFLENDLPEGKIILLDNVRFYYKLEQSKDDSEREKLAQRIASFGDIFINDAFGTCHRKEASVYDVAKFLPCGIGYLVDKEINMLSSVLETPEKPYYAILGGAKVADKIKVIETLAKKVDGIIIIGAMEYAFLKAQGKNVGKSLCEGVETAKAALESEYKDKLIFALDTVVGEQVGEEFGNFDDIKTVPAGEIPDGHLGLDIGDKTISMIKDKISGAKTIFWNGPSGVFEIKPFDKGTNAIAQAIADSGCKSVVGGGDSVTAIEKSGIPEDKFTHLSTGGGASMEFIENNGRLPALDIQEEKNA